MPEVKGNLNQFIVSPSQEQYYDFSHIHVPSYYIVASKENWRLTQDEQEATYEEVLRHMEKSKSFDFLNDPEEDIYELEDGEPV